MKSLVRITLAILALGLCGCSEAPQLASRFTPQEYQLSFDESLRRDLEAPVIVLGRITGVTRLGAPQRFSSDPRVLTQLVQIAVDIEVPIRGVSGIPSLNFYFFTFSGANTRDLGRPYYIPEIGQQRIFFLEPWLDTYRSIGDVYNYHLSAYSGTHDARICEGKQTGCCIAEILLTAKEDVDVRGFVHELGPYSAYAAGQMCSPKKAQELLTRLAAHPDRRIAAEAVDTLGWAYAWWPELKTAAR